MGAERVATCALASLPGIGPQSLELLKGAHGSLAAAAAVGGRELAKVAGLRIDGVRALAEAPDLEARGQWLLDESKRRGYGVLVCGEDSYPPELAAVPGAPPVLYVHGALPARRRVAIVGSRHSDAYGLEQTRQIAGQVARAGLVVLSGGAEGVDTAAHEQAMKLGAPTVAVVGSGLLNPYPALHRELYDRIARNGAVVSEFPLDARGPRQHFPQRNRTMAGLAAAVVLTRGRSGSGALSTCEAAVRFARPVFAVPGRVDEPDAFAPNSLLSNGSARALVTGAELFDALGLRAPADAPSNPRPAASPATPANVGPVFGALGPDPRHVDELAVQAGVSTAVALVELLELELAGLCSVHPGKYFARR